MTEAKPLELIFTNTMHCYLMYSTSDITSKLMGKKTTVVVKTELTTVFLTSSLLHTLSSNTSP